MRRKSVAACDFFGHDPISTQIELKLRMQNHKRHKRQTTIWNCKRNATAATQLRTKENVAQTNAALAFDTVRWGVTC